MFLNITHPSQILEKHRQTQIRSYTARQRVIKKCKENRKSRKDSSLVTQTSHLTENTPPQDAIGLPAQAKEHSKVDLRILFTPGVALCDDKNAGESVQALEYCKSHTHDIDHGLCLVDIKVLGPHGAWPESNYYCQQCSSGAFKHFLYS